jgi:hypothetical protein
MSSALGASVPVAASNVSITNCAQDPVTTNEADIAGTLFNDHPSSADYYIQVNVFQNGKSVGVAIPEGPISGPNNIPPFGYDSWFATLKPIPPGSVTCSLKSVNRSDQGGPSGHLTYPTEDVSLTNCQDGGTAPYATVNVYNNHDSSGTYVVNVAFDQAGKTFTTVTVSDQLQDIEAYDHAQEQAVAIQMAPTSGAVTCALAGVYRWG